MTSNGFLLDAWLVISEQERKENENDHTQTQPEKAAKGNMRRRMLSLLLGPRPMDCCGFGVGVGQFGRGRVEKIQRWFSGTTTEHQSREKPIEREHNERREKNAEGLNWRSFGKNVLRLKNCEYQYVLKLTDFTPPGVSPSGE